MTIIHINTIDRKDESLKQFKRNIKFAFIILCLRIKLKYSKLK